MKRRKAVCLVALLCLVMALFGSMPVNAYTYAELKDMPLLNQASLDASISYMGDVTRTANLLRKAERGEEITIAFIGGSITFGSGVVDNDGTNMDRFSEHIQAWFREKFPNTVCRMVNAGLPATGSMIGVFRLDNDVLQYNPDLLVIEYAVNEGTTYGTNETSEALIRKTIANNPDAAVMFLFMAKGGGSGWGDPAGKQDLAQYYGLPCISWKNGVNKAVQDGLATNADFDADGTHPNKNGQAAMSSFIIHYLEKVYADLDTAPTEIPALPEPKISDDFAYAKHLSSLNFAPSSLGNFQISDTACQYGQFKNGWTVKENGEAFKFECEAKRLYIPFQCRTNTDGVVKVKINGIPVALLSAKSNDYTRLSAGLVFQSETTKKIQVEIEHVAGGQFDLSGIWIAY